jgi:Zn-dependent peptidase ImmA (M78 family)/DNA-binding XRE family transcriptional regulator
MPSIRANIKPALLVWARETMNYTVEAAARKLNVSPDRLRQWEAGEGAPTIAQLRSAARVYKRPLAVFYLPEPPRTFDALRDYRRPSDGLAASPELAFEIRQAHARREILLELAVDLDIEIPGIQNDLRDLSRDPQRFSEEARRILGVTLEAQQGWRAPRIALNNWIRALEAIGVLVFRTRDVETSEMRGFAIYQPVLPVIVANGKDAYSGQIFTLLHEFAHILLRQQPLCDEQEYGQPDNDDQRVEVFCNRVAGELLVPQVALEHQLRAYRLTGEEIDEETLRALASSFAVSREVIVRRLLTLGRVGAAFYRRKREAYMRELQQLRQEQSGFAPPYTMAVRDLGRFYVRTVFDAFRQEAITSADLSSYLNLKLKHLRKVEQAVYAGGET